MVRRSPAPLAVALLALAGVVLGVAVATLAQTPKRGGVLNAMLAEDPPGFSIHESATISGVWPVMPCYSNLVLFDPLKAVEQWFATLTRREFQIGANLTASGIDDPDGFFYENYRCGASRNYTDYCSEEVDRLIDLQSQELDRGRRQALVWEIQRKLEADVARPMLGWRKEYFTQWPFVRNLVPHHSLYSYGRMQEVWLDR